MASSGARYLTRRDFERHTGRKMHSGVEGMSSRQAFNAGIQSERGARPAQPRSSHTAAKVGAGAGVGYAAGRGHVRRHGSIALPMAVLFMAMVIQSGVVPRFVAWVKSKTTGPLGSSSVNNASAPTPGKPGYSTGGKF